jgi:hypothetical protein
LLGEAPLEPVHELGVQAPTGPCGRVVELLAKMRRHPEQEAVDLPWHISVWIFSDLRSNINFNHADINPSTRPNGQARAAPSLRAAEQIAVPKESAQRCLYRQISC